MPKKQVLSCIFLLIFALSPVSVWAASSNDPGFYQWGFEDTGVYGAWDQAIGSRGVVVAIIDNGFDTFHPDLYPNVWKNEDEIDGNNIDDDNNGYIDDVWGWDFIYRDLDGDGRFSEDELKGNNNPRPDVVNFKASTDRNVIHHGTLVAGIIGAVGNNSEAMSGINWNVRLMNLKAVSENGDGHNGSLVDAIRYAVNNGADIINISMVTGLLDDRIKAEIERANDKGVAVVAAAGNNQRFLGDNPLYPICLDSGLSKPLILGVSAISEDHRKAYFSNFGSGCIDITAPGVNITSTMRYAPRHGYTEKYSGGWNGTSFATPFVTGALALIKSVQPSWGANMLYDAVLKTVHKTPPDDEESYAHLFGSGLLQIDKAVEYAISKLPKRAKGNLLSFVNLKSGLVEERKVNGENSFVNRSVLKDKSEMDSFLGDTNVYATIKKLNGALEIDVYDSNWNKISSFNVKTYGDYGIKLGNVINGGDPEIILYPKSASKTVFQVYSIKGDLLHSSVILASHSGVSVGIIDNFPNDIIAATYKTNSEKMSLKLFNDEFNVFQNIELHFFDVLPSITSGDIDGDSIKEIVVASGRGQTPFVGFYEQNGEWKRSFYGRELSYTGGFDVKTIDYNADGKEDVVLSSFTDNKVEVWNGQAKKVAEFTVFQNKGVVGLNGLFLIK